MDTPKPKRRWFRFSLRTLFVSTTVIALGTYWLTRPTILANEFVRAFKAGEYTKVEGMFTPDSQSWHKFPGSFGTKEQLQKTAISIWPITWREIFGLRRNLYIEIPYGEGMYEMDWQISVEATPQGLRILSVVT